MVDDRKAAIYKMMEQLNVLAADSTQFLEFVGKKFAEIERLQDETEIWELCRVDRDKLIPRSERKGSPSSKDAGKSSLGAPLYTSVMFSRYGLKHRKIPSTAEFYMCYAA